MGMKSQMTKKEFVPFAVEVHVSNFATSLSFYNDSLGFKVIREEKEAKFASLEFQGSIFMIREVGGLSETRGEGVVLRFIVPDIKSYYESLQKKNAKIVAKLETMPYGLTRFYVDGKPPKI